MAMAVARDWYEVQHLSDGVSLIREKHVADWLRCNIWHVQGRDRDMIVDTGMGVVSLRDSVSDMLDKPVTAAATHAHVDHVGSHHEFDHCLVHKAELDDLKNGYEAAMEIT